MSNLFHVANRKNKPVVMEVIGPNGLKVAEYVDKGKDELPYHKIND